MRTLDIETRNEILEGIILFCQVAQLKLDNPDYDIPPCTFRAIQKIIEFLERIETTCGITVPWNNAIFGWYHLKHFGDGDVSSYHLKMIILHKTMMLEQMVQWLTIFQLERGL